MNYYTVLGVNKNASYDEIKKAYRRLVIVYHPDKYSTLTDEVKKNELTIKFISVNSAYNVLIDPDKRKIYDLKGLAGLEEADKKKKQDENINEARERNKKNREEREKRKLQKDLERKLKEEQELRKKLDSEKIARDKELEELEIKKQKELLTKQLAAQMREKEAAEKRRKEIEEQNKLRIQLLTEEENKKREIQIKIRNKEHYLRINLRQLITPFKNIVMEINHIDILDVEEYIYNHIINKFSDVIINLDKLTVKDLYLKLKKIKEYFDTEYNEPTTKKNLAGKKLLRLFINLSIDFGLDRYVIEQYEEYLKKTNSYDNNNFDFLKKISDVYINLSESIIPNIYFI